MGEKAPAQAKQTAVSAGHASSGSLQRKCACGAHTASEQCDSCKSEGGLLQRKASSQRDPSSVPPIVHEVLRSPGQPLDAATRAFFEPRFGHDFSGVRVHTDQKAVASTDAIKAQAYTVGNNIAFGAGLYAPMLAMGKRLLAHELVHIVQQHNSAYLVPDTIRQPNDALEHDADLIADAVSGSAECAAVKNRITSGVARSLQPKLSESQGPAQGLRPARSNRFVPILFTPGTLMPNGSLNEGTYKDENRLEEAWKAVIEGAILKSVVIEGGSSDSDPQNAVLIAMRRAVTVWDEMKYRSEGLILERMKKNEITVSLKPSVTSLSTAGAILKKDRVLVHVHSEEE